MKAGSYVRRGAGLVHIVSKHNGASGVPLTVCGILLSQPKTKGEGHAWRAVPKKTSVKICGNCDRMKGSCT